MKQYMILFEISIDGKTYKHYMIATEKTTLADIERFCRTHDYFGKTIVTIAETEEPILEPELNLDNLIK